MPMDHEERTGYRSGDPRFELPGSARPGTPAHAPAPLCDLCGRPMQDRHCKLICLACGYQRDCSDP
jgi:hypothetical protein